MQCSYHRLYFSPCWWNGRIHDYPTRGGAASHHQWDSRGLPRRGLSCQLRHPSSSNRRTSLPILPDIFLAWSRGSHENLGKPSTFSIWTVVYRNGCSLIPALTAGQAPSHTLLQRLASNLEHGFNLAANSTGYGSSSYSCASVSRPRKKAAGILMCLVQTTQGPL